MCNYHIMYKKIWGVSSRPRALLVMFRLQFGPLLTIVGAGCWLAASIYSLDSSILLGVFRPASNWTVGALATVPQVETSHTYVKRNLVASHTCPITIEHISSASLDSSWVDTRVEQEITLVRASSWSCVMSCSSEMGISGSPGLPPHRSGPSSTCFRFLYSRWCFFSTLGHIWNLGRLLHHTYQSFFMVQTDS